MASKEEMERLIGKVIVDKSFRDQVSFYFLDMMLLVFIKGVP